MAPTLTATTPAANTDEAGACCAPGAGPMMSAVDAERLAGSLKAIADPARLRLLSMVSGQPEKEACVCEMTEPLALSQGTVSHHLKVLVDAGLLQREQRGRWAYYRVVPDAIGDLAYVVTQVTSG